MKKSRFTHRP